MEETDNNFFCEKTSLFSKINTYRSEFICLLGILCFSAVLIFLQRLMEPQQGRDSSFYLLLAEKWYNDGFYSAVEYVSGVLWVPPLHLYLIKILMCLGLSVESAALTIAMGCGILMPLVAFFITRELLHDKRLALAAALLIAVHPLIIGMSVQAQRDIPYLFICGMCIYFTIVAVKRHLWYWWCLAGSAFAVAFLFRYETAEILFVLGIYFCISLFKQQQKWYRIIKELAIFAISGLLVWALLLFLTGTINFIIGVYYRYFRNKLGYYFEKQLVPSEEIQNAGSKIHGMLDVFYKDIPSVVFEPIAVLGCLGLIIAFILYRKERTTIYLTVIFSLIFMVVWRIAIQIVTSRYAEILIFPMSIAAVYFIFQLANIRKFIPKFPEKYVKYVPICIFGILIITCIGKNLSYETYTPIMDIGNQIKEDVTPGKIAIYSVNQQRAYQIEYYSGVKVHRIPSLLNSQVDRLTPELCRNILEQILAIDTAETIYIFSVASRGEPVIMASEVGIDEGSWELFSEKFFNHKHKKSQRVYKYSLAK